MWRLQSWRPAVRTGRSSSGASTSLISSSPGALQPCCRCFRCMAYPHAPLPPSQCHPTDRLLVFHRARCPQGHAGPVTSVQLYSLPGGGALLVSTGGDAETRIWEGPGAGKADGVAGGWRLRQTISVDGKLQLSAALTAMTVGGDWCAGPCLLFCARLARYVPGLCSRRSSSSAALTSSRIDRHVASPRATGMNTAWAAMPPARPWLPFTRPLCARCPTTPSPIFSLDSMVPISSTDDALFPAVYSLSVRWPAGCCWRWAASTRRSRCWSRRRTGATFHAAAA